MSVVNVPQVAGVAGKDNIIYESFIRLIGQANNAFNTTNANITTLSGSIADVPAGHVMYGTGTIAIGSSANLFWNSTSSQLTVAGTIESTSGGVKFPDGTTAVGMFGTAAIGVVPASGGGTSNFLRADGTWVAPPGEIPSSRTISTTAPLTGGGDLSADRTFAITSFSGSAPGAVPTSAGGTTNFLRADGAWAVPAGSGGGTITGGGTINKLAKFTGATAIGDSLIHDNGTNVGVKTTAPVADFQVEGAAFQGTIALSNSSTAVTTGTSMGEIDFYSRDSTIGQPTVAYIRSVADADYVTTAPTSIVFATQSSGGSLSQNMRLWGSGALDVAGVVQSTSGGFKFPDATTQATAGVLPTRTISTTAPLTGGGNLSADRTLAISVFAGSAAGAVPSSLGGTTNFLRADGAWAAPAGSGGNISGTGTTGTLAKFTGATAIGDSVLTEVAGAIGLGTSLPVSPLHVEGTSAPGILTLSNSSTGILAGHVLGEIDFYTRDVSDIPNRVVASVRAVADADEVGTDYAPTSLVLATHGASGAAAQRVRIWGSGNTTLDVAGVARAKVWDQGGAVFNVMAYGAKADAGFTPQVSITTGTPNLTSAAAAWKSTDVGATIYVHGAGAAGGLLTTTISAFVSATAVTLAANASTTATNEECLWTHTDDTAAFAAACAAASAAYGPFGGGEVVVPPGSYWLAGAFTVPTSVTLRGAGAGSPIGNRSRLLLTQNAGVPGAVPQISLMDDATISGFTFHNPAQNHTATPTAYPFVMRLSPYSKAMNLFFYNIYQGIDAGWTSWGFGNASSVRISWVSGHFLNTGIALDRSADFTWIEHVHGHMSLASGLATYQAANAALFVVGRCDSLWGDDITALLYQYGVKVVSTANGIPYGTLRGLSMDQVRYGLYVEGTSFPGLLVSDSLFAQSGTFAAPRYCIYAPVGAGTAATTTYLHVTNCTFWGDGNTHVKWDNAGTLKLSGNRFAEWYGTGYCVDCSAGEVRIEDNQFPNTYVGQGSATGANAIRVQAGVARAIVMGNDLDGRALTVSNATNLYVGLNLA